MEEMIPNKEDTFTLVRYDGRNHYVPNRLINSELRLNLKFVNKVKHDEHPIFWSVDRVFTKEEVEEYKKDKKRKMPSSWTEVNDAYEKSKYAPNQEIADKNKETFYYTASYFDKRLAERRIENGKICGEDYSIFYISNKCFNKRESKLVTHVYEFETH